MTRASAHRPSSANVRLHNPPREWTDVKELLLAVEVLSPSTARADRERKRVIYQSEGVLAYWIVDARARRVELWRARARSRSAPPLSRPTAPP